MQSTGVTIFIPYGDPNGIKLIELSGWSGKSFIIPRGKLKDIKDREETNHPAIYFLIGEGEQASRQKVYVGESESFYARLSNHDINKDFWNSAIVFTSGLDRADVKYLENKSILLAKRLDRYEIINGVEPLENKLSEFKKSAVDDYFRKIQFILSLLGFTLFQDIKKEAQTSELYYLKTEEAEATGTILESGEFIIYKGSTARIRETDSFSGTAASLIRWKLKQEDSGVLKEHDDETFIFTQNFIFSSPSQAAATITGRAINGWTAWKDQEGNTLYENKRR